RPSVAWNLFRNLHQQISGWKARATCIRVSFVSIRGSNPPLHSFAIIRVNPCSSVANEPHPSVAWNLLKKFHQQISGWQA
ncbi:MAG: hypothetical protein ACK6EB_06070, partial [Planctomyces sp.]